MTTDDLVLISIAELGKMFGVSRTTIWRRVKTDPSFPRPMKNVVGVGLRWRRGAIEEYLDRLQAEADRAAHVDRP